VFLHWGFFYGVYVAYCYVGGMVKNGSQGGSGSYRAVFWVRRGVCTFYGGKGPYGACKAVFREDRKYIAVCYGIFVLQKKNLEKSLFISKRLLYLYATNIKP